MKDLRTFQKVPAFMEGFDRMFEGYPEMIREVMNGMFIVDGTPVPHIKETAMPAVKQVGMMNVLRDVRGALKAL